MKNKLFNALKQAYSDLGLGDNFLQNVAASLSATGLVTDENLQGVVDAQKDAIKAAQSAQDKLRTEKSALEKQVKELSEKKEDKGKEDKEKKEDEPEWFTRYKQEQEARVKGLEDENKSFKDERTKSERSALISSKAKELGIPDWRIKEGLAVSDDMDETAIGNYLSTVKTNIIAAGLDKSSGYNPATSEAEAKARAEGWADSLPDAK